MSSESALTLIAKNASSASVMMSCSDKDCFDGLGLWMIWLKACDLFCERIYCAALRNYDLEECGSQPLVNASLKCTRRPRKLLVSFRAGFRSRGEIHAPIARIQTGRASPRNSGQNTGAARVWACTARETSRARRSLPKRSSIVSCEARRRR